MLENVEMINRYHWTVKIIEDLVWLQYKYNKAMLMCSIKSSVIKKRKDSLYEAIKFVYIATISKEIPKSTKCWVPNKVKHVRLINGPPFKSVHKENWMKLANRIHERLFSSHSLQWARWMEWRFSGYLWKLLSWVVISAMQKWCHWDRVL